MIKEIDKVVRERPGLYCNRQQFIESAIREKIEKTEQISLANQMRTEYEN